MDGIRGIIFDKDGTLFEFGASWNEWAKTFLLSLTEDDLVKATHLGAVIGFDVQRAEFHPSSPVIAGTPDEIAALLLPHVDNHSLLSLVSRMNDAAAQTPMCEVVPLAAFLARLSQAGIALGVATNDAEFPAREHLMSAGVLEQFEFIAGSDSGYGAKPAPGQLLAFLNATELSADQTVMVGDSRHDLSAGRAAGMKTIGVLTGVAAAEDLADLADVVVPDIGHIFNVLVIAT